MNQQNIKNHQVRVIEAVPLKTRQTNQSGYTMSKQLKRVCAYCRVSTDQVEQQSSYDLQVHYYTDYIKNNTLWEFAGIYADEGVSGTSTKRRDEFQRMIHDCEDGKIDMIITKSISRFARNTLDCLGYVRKLKNLPSPVGIFFEKENIDTLDARSELLLTILSSLAQDESRSISENIRWSIQKKFQSGKAHCPTTYFLGYDTNENGELVINEEQAKTVQRIYKEYLAGDGTALIAKGLTNDGILTARGNTSWTSNGVYLILRNEKYCGDILMQKCVTLDFLTHKRVKNNGHQPQYFITDHHPAIISKDDWNAVQAELSRRNVMSIHNNSKNEDDENYEKGMEKGQRHSNRSVFSNILFCSTCGEPFFRRTFQSTVKGEVYKYNAWRCRASEGRITGKTCHARSYRELILECTFMDMLLDMKHKREQLTNDFETALANIKQSDEEIERMEDLQKQIDDINEKLNEASSLTQHSIAGDIYDEFTNELTEQLEELNNEWSELNRNKYQTPMIQKNFIWLMEQLDTIPEYDPNTERIPFREDIFKRLINRGDCRDDAAKDEVIIDFILSIGIKYIAIGNSNMHKEMKGVFITEDERDSNNDDGGENIEAKRRNKSA